MTDPMPRAEEPMSEDEERTLRSEVKIGGRYIAHGLILGALASLDHARRERDEARGALESVEWSEFNDGCCPACGSAPIEDHGTGHAPDCVIDKALRGGGS